MDFDASRPIWLRLREGFTRRIIIGRWAPDKQTPGIRELAVELRVNPNTVQRTLIGLECDGPCRSERVVGRFVTNGAERASWLRCDLATGTADEFMTQVKGFGLPGAEAMALIAEGWNQ